MLKAINLSKSYGNNRVFTDFNYNFLEGEINIIMGENSSGKSTLLRCLANINSLDTGSLYFQNKLIKSDNINFKKQVSIHFAGLDLFPLIKPSELFKFHFKAFNETYPHQDIQLLIDQFKLQSYYENCINTLSSGTIKKFFLILSILRTAKIYLFDEPSAYLDIASKITLANYIIKLTKNNNIVIISTHDNELIEIIEKECTDFIKINKINLDYF